MTVERPPIPSEERKPAWRLACLTYREIRQADASHQEALEAAVAAMQCNLHSWKEASAEAVNAIADATKYNSEWFWRGRAARREAP
jgi:hypothetical protein